MKAKLLIYVRGKLKLDIPQRVTELSREDYNGIHDTDYVTAQLCSLLKTMPDEQRLTIIYDAHVKESRDLANWWEAHQKADAIREAKEQEERDKAKLQDIIDNPLSQEFLECTKAYSGHVAINRQYTHDFIYRVGDKIRRDQIMMISDSWKLTKL